MPPSRQQWRISRECGTKSKAMSKLHFLAFSRLFLHLLPLQYTISPKADIFGTIVSCCILTEKAIVIVIDTLTGR